MRGNPRKVRAVAREVYSELLGVQDSARRIGGPSWQPRMTVEERFPRGVDDVEGLVTDVCNESAPDERPFSVLSRQFVSELGLSV